MNNILNSLAYLFEAISYKIKVRAMQYRLIKYSNIHQSVKLGLTVKLIGLKKSFFIGKGTYINDAILAVGCNSKIMIGEYCSIGYRVSIKSLTHQVMNPCQNKEGIIDTLEKDIYIGNACWIGDNVFIREGVVLGENVIVGANSVVTKSFPSNVIIAGVPAKIIKEVC